MLEISVAVTSILPLWLPTMKVPQHTYRTIVWFQTKNGFRLCFLGPTPYSACRRSYRTIRRVVGATSCAKQGCLIVPVDLHFTARKRSLGPRGQFLHIATIAINTSKA